MNRGPYIRIPREKRHGQPTGPAPVVIGDISPDGSTVILTCPWCCKRHEHGTPELEPDGAGMKLVGLRQSHCADRPAGSYRIIGRLAS